MAREVIRCRAEVAAPADGPRLWRRLDAVYGGYRRYRTATTRELTMFRLRRTGRGETGTMPPADHSATVGRLLRVSGGLEVMLGTGHTLLGTLILTRPQSVAWIVAGFGWPVAILAPIAPPEQHALVLAMSVGSGLDWLVFGAILLREGWMRPAHPDVPLLRLALLHQVGLAVLMVLCVRWHVLAVTAVLVMVATLGRALTLAGVTRPSG